MKTSNVIKNILGVSILLVVAFPVFAFASSLSILDEGGTPKTQFDKGDEIYLEGVCLPVADKAAKVYVTQDKVWQTGDPLYDVSMGIETFLVNNDGKINLTKIWNRANVGVFDVLIDTNNNLKIDEHELQCIIGSSGFGFRVGTPPTVSTPTPTPTLLPTSLPTPVSTPTPTPPPSEPSETFEYGDYAQVKSLSNVRETPGGTLVGTQIQDAVGRVVGGPMRASLGGNSYWFWNIDFKNDPDGWVAEKTLKLTVAPTPEPTEKPAFIEETTGDTQLSPGAAVGVSDDTDFDDETKESDEDDSKMKAQVSDADSSLMGSVFIALALFAGLVFGSIIISRSLGRVRK
ncbi:hypothetical protein ACFLY5_01155 [Patescibacteria group bacterium]